MLSKIIDFFELKIPPVAVVIICVIMMILLSKIKYFTLIHADISPNYAIQAITTSIAVLIAFIGLSIGIMGLVSFSKAQTTANPIKIQAATTLVTKGFCNIYQLTRNPMYLGLLFILIGFGIFLANILSIISISFYIAYMTKFQIKPEERMLQKIFGNDFNTYQAKVRRWI